MKKKLIIFLSVLIFVIIINNFQYPTNIKELQSITILDNTQQEVYYETNNRPIIYTPFDEIPKEMIEMIVTLEDKRFYSHHGFDFIRIIGAIIKNIFGKKEGASTITQQLARLLFLNNEKTLTRKIKELIIALRLEAIYTKKEILECYLNNVYFGYNCYGIYQASQLYFGSKPENLDIIEMAVLVGLIKSPAKYNPITNPHESLKRAALVLKKINYPINNNLALKNVYKRTVKLYPSSILFFKDIVLSQVNQKSIVIESTFDARINHYNASICVVKPFSGAVLSISSGDYYNSSYNEAYHSKRPIASTVKPFLYYTALNCGMKPTDKFISQKTSFKVGDEIYTPQNFLSLYPNCAINMCYALATSDNIYAVKTLLNIGISNLVSTLNLLNIPSSHLASLALGAVDVSLLTLSSAYNTFASLGLYYKPYFIEKIYRNGKEIYQHQTNEKRILRYDSVYTINEMMTLTFDANLNGKINVTGSSITNQLKAKYAGKSGTSTYDSYMMGFNPNIFVGVRTKNDDYGLAKRIWAEIINQYDKSWYHDDKMKYTYTEVNPYNPSYKTKIYYNDYLPKTS